MMTLAFQQLIKSLTISFQLMMIGVRGGEVWGHDRVIKAKQTYCAAQLSINHLN